MELTETSVFTRQVKALLSEEEYRQFQSQLVANPSIRSVIKGGGGVRKIRVAVGLRGKSGGARVIYYWAVRKNVILLLYLYAKNETANLTAGQLARLAKIVKEEFGNESKSV